MNTPYLDAAIKMHEKANDKNLVPFGAKEALEEFKAIKEALKQIAYDALHWDVDTDDFSIPSNMFFSFGAELDDTSIESLSKNDDGIRWVIFRVESTWYVMEQYKSEYGWVESWTKQINSNVKEAKNYAEHEANKHYK